MAEPLPSRLSTAWQKAFLDMEGVRFHSGMIDLNKEIPDDGCNRWLVVDDLKEELTGKGDTNQQSSQKHQRVLRIAKLISEGRADDFHQQPLLFSCQKSQRCHDDH